MSEAGPGSPGRWLLAIDTSSTLAGLALFDGARLDETTWLAGTSQTATVLEELDRLLSRAGLEVGQLQAVGVATGPGMFNALRVGMSVAKGLVLATGVPLIGVSTLAATAFPYLGSSMPVLAVVAAGRSRLVWQMFRDIDASSSLEVPPRNGTLDELQEMALAIGAPVWIAGELTDDQRSALATTEQIVIPPLAGRQRRPGATAGLAFRRWSAGDADDPVLLEPEYVHAPARR